MTLTPRQAEVLAYIRRYVATEGLPPTHREIAKHLGVSVRWAWELIDSLERDGAISRIPRIPRAIRVNVC